MRLSILATCVTLIVLGVLCETLLRLAGHQPWTYNTKDEKEPVVYENDPVLGWRNKEGSYVFKAYSPDGEDIRMTFLADGRRVTGQHKIEGRDKVVILGGSYTQGWAISDNETYSWKLQNRFSDLEVLNYGSGGYGACQSLMLLEELLAGSKRPKTVVYGFMWHHEVRNVAPPRWIAALSKLSRRRAHVAVPYCTIESDGALVRHPPESYTVWPLSEVSATVRFVQDTYMRVRTRRRDSQKRQVTEKLFLELSNLAKNHGAKFLVVLLYPSEKQRLHYLEFLQANGIQVVDCTYPMTEEMKVRGEGHPNGKMNTLWAECIGEAL